jgi:hypothetical protein
MFDTVLLDWYIGLVLLRILDSLTKATLRLNMTKFLKTYVEIVNQLYAFIDICVYIYIYMCVCVFGSSSSFKKKCYFSQFTNWSLMTTSNKKHVSEGLLTELFQTTKASSFIFERHTVRLSAETRIILRH